MRLSRTQFSATHLMQSATYSDTTWESTNQPRCQVSGVNVEVSLAWIGSLKAICELN